jgi:hypothetical protein
LRRGWDADIDELDDDSNAPYVADEQRPLLASVETT